MAKSINVKRKKPGRGRPATGTEPLYGVRIADGLMKQIMDWGKSHGATRSEAIRRLVELGLTIKTSASPVRKPGRRLRAQELATKAIEKIIDPSARRKNAPSAGAASRRGRRNSEKIGSICRNRNADLLPSAGRRVKCPKSRRSSTTTMRARIS
jgi:hypothetical protein